MTKATEKRIYLTRHGEAEHNLDWSADVRDAPLTQRGRHQAAQLYEQTKDTVQKTAELLVSSGLSRPLSTMVIGFADLRKRLEAEGKAVVVLPQLQEASEAQCNIGSSRAALEADPEYAGLDFSMLTWDWTLKRGFYAPQEGALEGRARWCRRWLRARPEREIVVVGHNAFFSYMTDKSINSITMWDHAQVRVFTFETEEGAEEDPYDDAWLVPVKETEESETKH